MIGRTIARYQIVAKLGEGGMATVWQARDQVLERTVALKFLPESMTGSADARRRFLHEARAASALDHPGIAHVFDAGEADGRLYIAYAYVDGRSLSQLLQQGPLPVDEAVRIACAAAEALDHAHGRGVIHRDMSPGNIMVARDGVVKIVDFGLAREIAREKSRISRTGDIPGTVHYIAPEVLTGNDADARSDLYGLGSVLYEMLTGGPPFRGARLDAVGYQTVHEKPKPPSAQRPGVPVAIDRIVLRLLAKDPALRYASAEELAHDLRSRRAPREAVAAGVAERRARTDRRGTRRRTGPEVGSHRSARPGGARSGRKSSAPGGVPELRVLAVLPFRDASSAAGAASKGQVLARGLAETVSARLARVAGIQVIPPSAVPADRRGAEDLRGLARELDANLFLSGTVQREGPKVRVTFSLLDAQPGIQVGGEILDGPANDILALEDRLVRSVVRALELELGASGGAAARGLEDPAAHEHYLQALGYLMSYENEASVDGAIALLEGLVGTNGESAAVEAALGRAYVCKYQLTLEPRWTRSARAACQRALELEPRSPQVLVTLAHLHVETGHYPQAIREYRKALAMGMREPDVLLGLGLACAAARQFDQAESTFREAIAIRPSYWAGYNRLGVFYFNQGRFEEAANLWRRVIELAPNNARGHYNLAGAYFRMGRYADAIASYRRSLEIQPSATAYSSLGTVHFFLGHYEESAAMFEKGAALQPFNAVKWGNLGDAYRWMPGREDKAAAAFDQAIALMKEQLELNPRDGKHWAELATWLAKRGRAREALQALRKGLRLSPKDVGCMALAVRVYHLAGKREQALRWLGEAVERGHDANEFDRDPELAMLRSDPRFRQTLREPQAG